MSFHLAVEAAGTLTCQVPYTEKISSYREAYVTITAVIITIYLVIFLTLSSSFHHACYLERVRVKISSLGPDNSKENCRGFEKSRHSNGASWSLSASYFQNDNLSLVPYFSFAYDQTLITFVRLMLWLPDIKVNYVSSAVCIGLIWLKGTGFGALL